MGWSIKRKPQPGWLALGMHRDRVDLVCVTRNGDSTPAVVVCDSFRMEGSEAHTLGRLTKSLRLERYRCTTLLSSPHYHLHHIDTPAVPAPEVKAAVRWRVKDLIDYPLEAATIEVLTVPADPGAPERDAGLYALTARTEAIQTCARPFTESRTPLHAIDIPDLAQRNIAALFEAPESGLAMLAFYEGEGILTFTRSGELLLSRHIDIALDDLVQDGTAREERLERIALEVQRSLDNFGHQYKHIEVSRLLLGPLPADIGLLDHLSSNLAVAVEPVELARVMDLAAVPQLQMRQNQSQYFDLIGAALRGSEPAYA
jgi:MSHA biogenesis protein MshI